MARPWPPTRHQSGGKWRETGAAARQRLRPGRARPEYTVFGYPVQTAEELTRCDYQVPAGHSSGGGNGRVRAGSTPAADMRLSKAISSPARDGDRALPAIATLGHGCDGSMFEIHHQESGGNPATDGGIAV